MLLHLRSPIRPRTLTHVSLLLLLISVAVPAFARWPEVSQVELALTAPRLDPTAPAEILYHETIVDDRGRDAKFKHYKRVKIFDARAIESFSPVNITYRKGTRIRNVEARVIKPTGEVVELSKADVYDREVFRRGNVRSRVRSFTIPGVEPGCIVEYRWESVAKYSSASGSFYTPVQEFPVHHGHYRFYPWRGQPIQFKWFAMPAKPDINSSGLQVEVHDILGEPDDSFQPPYFDCYPWLCSYYSSSSKTATPDVYWPRMAERLGDWNRDWLTPKNRHVRRKAEELLAGAETDAERIRRLYEYCVGEIRNYDWPDSGFTQAEIARLPSNDSPAQTLKRGYGDSSDLIMLFGSLAGAAGFDVQLALVNDSSLASWKEDLLWSIGVPDFLIAIQTNGEYTFYDVSTRHLPPGKLAARNSGVKAFLGRNKKDWKWVTTQTMPAGFSRIERTGNLTVDENGNLSGHIELRYFGDDCLDLKSRIEARTEDSRLSFFRHQLRTRLPASDLFDLQVVNLLGNEQPLVVRAKVSVPGYAERVGERLLLPPSFFERGRPPLFISETRKVAVCFDRGWNKTDTIYFTLPEGWSLESEGGPTGVLDTGKFSHTTSIDASGSRLKFTRTEKVAHMILPLDAYQHVRTIFAEINRQDQLQMVFSPGPSYSGQASAAHAISDAPSLKPPAGQ